MSGTGEVQNHVLRLLALGPATAQDLAVEVQFGGKNLNRVLATLTERKLIRVSTWVQVPRSDGALRWRPVFSLGGGRNRARPRVKSNTERMRASRAAKAKRVSSVFDLAVRGLTPSAL